MRKGIYVEHVVQICGCRQLYKEQLCVDTRNEVRAGVDGTELGQNLMNTEMTDVVGQMYARRGLGRYRQEREGAGVHRTGLCKMFTGRDGGRC